VKRILTLALALMIPLLLGSECPQPRSCIGIATGPRTCTETCEGRSLEWLKDPAFGDNCGFCRCFDNPNPYDPRGAI